MARAPQRPSLPALGLLDPEVLVLDLANSWLVVYLKAARMIHNALFHYWRLNCLSGFDFRNLERFLEAHIYTLIVIFTTH